MAGGRGALRVPERWTDYIPLGCRMPGTRFIAFKVPLKKSFDQNLLPEERFSPRDLIRKVEERKEELGLIIDLTYTTRYYGREDLPPTLRYTKIVTMGHKIPNKKTISMFRYMVKKFLTRNKDNDKLIGVHCTHGLNRTGYLVCRYLIDVEGMEPNAAIELFNKSRGHPIERINYIRDLQKRALKNCEPKNSGSDVFREKGSAPAKPQKQLVKHHPSQAPLAVPRSPSSTKEQRPDPRAQGQPQELGHGHRALGQRQQEHLEQRHLEQKKLERRQQKKLKQLEQNHLERHHQEQRQQKKQNHQEQRQKKKLKHLEQNHLEQRQQKKLKHLEQNHQEQRQLEEQHHKKMKHQEQRQLEEQHHLEQRQQKKLKYQEQNHEEQRQQKKVKYLEQNHLEQRQLEEQNHLEQRQQKKLKHLEQNHLEPNHQEQRQKKMKHLEQNHLEQRQLEEQHHLEQREQKKLKHLEQNHQEQRQQKKLKHQEQRQQKKLKHQEQRQLEEQHPVEQRQPCSSAPRNCWLPQELSPARKRRRRKHELKEQEMS
ncbi:RNA/RNP complex-1-interacting phosphatase isoform X4 [Sylvia atricapilla]|uniref:RNA/RNP complex-1-interacting phosphatase isoform X4 n=1 Tax=Sylvia atricapilla TaxID=48155 RepID=UPI003398492B